MTDDFDFDTEIIIKLRHQGYSIREVPIPGSPSEMDSVQGWKCAGRVIRAMRRYRQTCRSLACHPEFQEYYVHYPLKAARYSSHDYACRMTGSGHDVLDVGCGEGFLAAELARNCNRVTGIDCRPRPRREASLERYWRLDLDRDSLAGRLRGQRFDRILLLDVLEHLLHPERVLKECRPLLRPDGAAIISLPNIANLAIRLGLLFGHFDYTERGILDRGHVRFFTRKTARRLVEENGYEIVEEKFTVIPLDLALGLRSNARLHRSLSRGLAALTRLFPGLLGYQIVLLARPRPAPVS